MNDRDARFMAFMALLFGVGAMLMSAVGGVALGSRADNLQASINATQAQINSLSNEVHGQ